MSQAVAVVSKRPVRLKVPPPKGLDVELEDPWSPVSAHARIEVTLRDIRLGSQGNPADCAIARAALHTFALKEHGQNIHIGNRTASIRDGLDRKLAWAPLPVEAQRFIRTFDFERASAEPLSFDLQFRPYKKGGR